MSAIVSNCLQTSAVVPTPVNVRALQQFSCVAEAVAHDYAPWSSYMQLTTRDGGWVRLVPTASFESDLFAVDVAGPWAIKANRSGLSQVGVAKATAYLLDVLNDIERAGSDTNYLPVAEVIDLLGLDAAILRRFRCVAGASATVGLSIALGTGAIAVVQKDRASSTRGLTLTLRVGQARWVHERLPPRSVSVILQQVQQHLKDRAELQRRLTEPRALAFLLGGRSDTTVPKLLWAASGFIEVGRAGDGDHTVLPHHDLPKGLHRYFGDQALPLERWPYAQIEVSRHASHWEDKVYWLAVAPAQGEPGRPALHSVSMGQVARALSRQL